MKLLDRKRILEADDLPRERVAVPEWGGEVLVRTMTAADRERYEQSLMVGDGESRRLDVGRLRAHLVLACVCDEAGAQIFTEGDVALLAQKSATAMRRVSDVAQRLNGIGVAEVEAEKKG